MSFDELRLQGQRVLFVASTGGHLAEIARLAPGTGCSDESTLITFDSAQSDAMSWIDDIRYIPYVKPRDLRGTLRSATYFRTVFRNERWDAVVSTGAAVAVPALRMAATRSMRSIYVESYARFEGPSTTGRLLQRLSPATELFTQHASWQSARWRYTGSVIDSFPRGGVPTGPLSADSRYFVTLGTIEPYRFDSLVDAVQDGLGPRAQIVWQLGCTSRPDLGGQVFGQLDRDAFLEQAREADVVITHGGVGTALELIEMGHRPYVIPRRAHRGEHVDDHQLAVAQDLAARDLAITCDTSELGQRLRARSQQGGRVA